MTRATSDEKMRLGEKNINTDKHAFWKRAGRRPALQNTRKASSDKRDIR
jgi:hypothetical protein